MITVPGSDNDAIPLDEKLPLLLINIEDALNEGLLVSTSVAW
jgi:hypothetical protein